MVRVLWSSSIDTLGQVARLRIGGNPWPMVEGYDGDLGLIDGEFP